MKLTSLILAIFFLYSSNLLSQELADQVKEVSAKISNSEQGERLQWMDSLTGLVKFKSDYKYDSIARNTLNYAIQLDSMSIVAKQMKNLVYHFSANNNDNESAYKLFEKYKQQVENMAPKDRCVVYVELGDTYKFDSKYQQALTYLDSAYIYAQKSNNQKIQASSKLYQAQVYANLGQYIDAFEAGKLAETNFVLTKNSESLIALKILLGVLKSQQEFYAEARQVYQEGAALAKETGDNSSLAILYNNISRDYKEENNVKESIYYGKLALETSNKSRSKDYLKPLLLNNMVKKYCDVDSLEMARKYIDSIKAFGPRESLDVRQTIYTDESLSYYYFKIGRLQEALDLWTNHQDRFGKQLGVESQLDSEKFLAKLYGAMKNSSKQAFHLQNYVKLYDSIKSSKNRQTLIYYQTKYETEKRDHTIETQEKDLNLLEQKNKIKNQWLLFGSAGLIGLFGFVLLVRSRNNAKEKEARQAEFSKNLLHAQEIERTRVAKDLHDGIGQKLSMLIRKAQNDEQGDFAEMATETLEEVRTISKALYPPMLKKLGLTKSIRHLLLEIDEQTDMFVSAEIIEIDDFFNDEETSTFYRFIQESVSNVMKHAKAKTLMVQITRNKNGLEAIIKDNGKGFAHAKEEVNESLGLKTMSERIKMLKGKFSINSTENSGTIITATISK